MTTSLHITLPLQHGTLDWEPAGLVEWIGMM